MKCSGQNIKNVLASAQQSRVRTSVTHVTLIAASAAVTPTTSTTTHARIVQTRINAPVYSVSLWIPPVSFCYPESCSEKGENVTSMAFMFHDIYNETGGLQRNTLYICTKECVRSTSKKTREEKSGKNVIKSSYSYIYACRASRHF